MKIFTHNKSKSYFTYFNFCDLFSIYCVNHLFNNAILFEMTLKIYVMYIKSKNVLN